MCGGKGFALLLCQYGGGGKAEEKEREGEPVVGAGLARLSRRKGGRKEGKEKEKGKGGGKPRPYGVW
jgi:hypothetical protein